MTGPITRPKNAGVRRRLLVGLTSLLVAVVLGVSGIGWYFSGLVVSTATDTEYDTKVVAITDGTLQFERNQRSVTPGTFGVLWPEGGHTIVGEIIEMTDSTVTRRLRQGTETLRPDVRVAFKNDVWQGDPQSARGLDFSEVSLATELGPSPAWLLSGTARWIIPVHGRGSSRAESLRMLPALRSTSMTVLVPTYRNHAGAPRSPDNMGHLGDTEWHDVDAAVTYALEHGATDVVLYGYSMGGAIVMETVQRSANAGRISGMVLDAPVLDWRHVLDHQGGKRDLPLPLSRLAQHFVQRRIDIDFEQFDQVASAKDLRVPVLLFHGEADDFVPPPPSTNLAAARADLVRYVRVAKAGHVEAWNVDSDRYETELLAFLATLPAVGNK